ncbi:hypothetical protein C8F04DRAFT_932973, partial [Mycena alexandri]
LRNQLQIKSHFLVYKGLHARHQGANIRSRTIVTRNESKIRLHSKKYQMAWEALRQLSPGGLPSEVGWELLKTTDIRCLEDEEDLEKKARKMEREREQRLKRKQKDSGDEMDVDSVPATRGAENRCQISWIWTVAG